MPLSPLPEPDSLPRRLHGLLCALPATLFLVTSLLFFNGLQAASLLLFPLSRRVFRAFNRWAADTWWGWCVQAARWFYGTGVVVSGDPLPQQENAIVIANHQQMPDITFLMFLARAKHRLGDMKWFVKDVIKYIPGVGWGMLFIDCVFVARDWAKDRDSIRRTFARLAENRVPVWLISFPEGTRIDPPKLARSREYAKKLGVEPPAHVLLPRTKGFVATVVGLRGHATAVYDVTIGYEQGVPTLWQYIRGLARRAHLHVRRYPLAELPMDDAALTAWIFARFREKDRLLDGFYRSGAFPAQGSGEQALSATFHRRRERSVEEVAR
ncbi:MAG: acyltransferase [Deltaproteobacteria bacterium]|nr:acyltransferase [Deltaproteobacteria bacterium]